MSNLNIKFKAWHISEQKMCDVKVLTDEGAFLIGVNKGEDVEYFNGGLVVEAPKEGRFCPHIDFVLLQYTWINDKNGKEIYTDHLLSNGELIFRVYQTYGGFIIKSWYWSENTTDLIPTDQLIFQPLSDLQTANYISESCEIIGDTYQNPELIKKIFPKFEQ